MSDMDRNKGSILILIAAFCILAGLLGVAFYTTVASYHRAAAESFDQERAVWAAESGVAYYLARLIDNTDYFDANPAPHPAVTLNDTTFELVRAEKVPSTITWSIVVIGRIGRGSYRMGAAIGGGLVDIPDGIVITGTGNPSSSVLEVSGTTTIASYNSDQGSFDIASPGSNGNLSIDGSLTLGAGTMIYGDVNASGSLLSGLPSYVVGDLELGVPAPAIEDIDPIVSSLLTSSKTANNNSVLSGIFGAMWTSVSGSENYGDLIVTSGTYVVPSGTYRLRRFEVRDGAKVTFDTQNGPSNLIYVGSGKGTGALNDLTVDNGSSVEINNGTTTNGLLTVLGPDCDFKVNQNSIYGRSTVDPGNSGFSQIISLGGNTSSDDIMATNNSTVYGRIYAAAHKLTVSGSKWYGSALVRTASISSSTFAVDEGSLGGKLVDPTTYSVLAQWQAGS